MVLLALDVVGRVLVPGAGQQLTDLAGDLAADRLHLVPEALDLGAQLVAGVGGDPWKPVPGPVGRWVPPVRSLLCSDRRNVLVHVWDGNDRKPVHQDVDTGATSGRGLLLVETMSAGWGTYIPQHSSGKIVWALAKSDDTGPCRSLCFETDVATVMAGESASSHGWAGPR